MLKQTVKGLLLLAAAFVSTAQAADTKEGTAAPDATPTANLGPANAEFQKTMQEWKKLIGELTLLQAKAKKATKEETPALRRQWAEKIKQAEALQPKLFDAVEKAYAEAPGADKECKELLVAVLPEKIFADDYVTAARIGKLLIDHDDAKVHTYACAGIAALMLNDFPNAEKYLGQCQKEKYGSNTPGDKLANLVVRYTQEMPKLKKEWEKEQKIRESEAKADDLPRVLIRTAKGDMEIELFENEAPIAVANFITLAEKGFYNGLTFHRVLDGFMAQGGCPKGDGTGGPGYTIPCECYKPNYRRHFMGTLSMAHAGRDTGGSQFFITFVPTSFLDGKHTAFGRVIKGMDVLAKIQRRDPEDPNAPDPDKIIEIKVLRKRPHEYAVKKS